MISLRRTSWVVFLLLALASCQPADREIVVLLRNGKLVADFPWSVWRLIGLQNRSYCIRRVELFDQETVLWSLNVPETTSPPRLCVRMPLPIGQSAAGFVSVGRPQLRNERVYGLAIDGTGNGRVDFVLRRGVLSNITEPEQQLEAPCGSQFRTALGTPMRPGWVDSSSGC
jgi:hypothetical protein